MLVIKYLVQHIGTREEVKFRQAYYANVLSLTQAQLKKNIQDIALTIGLHPTSLGVESECDGRIYIPESVRITTRIAENLYKVAQAKDATLASTKDKNLAHKAALRACSKMTLASEQTIPSKVMDIRITKGTVRIVIVVEHRNIGTRLDAIQKELPNAIIIMVNLPSVSDVTGADRLHSRRKVIPHMQHESSSIYYKPYCTPRRSSFFPTMIRKAHRSLQISNTARYYRLMPPTCCAAQGWSGGARPRSSY